MAENKFYMIGSLTKDNNGTKFFGGNTDSGCYFKDSEAFYKHTGVCYIPEYGFNSGVGSDFSILVNNENFEKLNKAGEIETYDSILYDCIQVVKVRYNLTNEQTIKEFAEELAADAFEMCDWQHIDTYLSEYDTDELYAEFCEKKLMDFETFAIQEWEKWKKENNIIDDDEDRFINEIYFLLGEDCFLDNPDWNYLLDAWRKMQLYKK